jgi:hypothetical protein
VKNIRRTSQIFCVKFFVSVTWVLFPGEIPGSQEEFLRAREKEIDDKLEELGIDTSTMTNVPLNLPFQPEDEK